MGIDEIIKIIASETGTLALAVLALYMLKRSYEERLEDRTEFSAELKEQRDYAREHRAMLERVIVDVSRHLGESTEVQRQVLEELRRIRSVSNNP